MKAMILAAGLGTRLRPLTDARPKALVEINGRTLLEITLTRLRSFGVNEVIINVHHFADLVVDYLKSHNNFDMRIEISREEDLLLDTGGGLKKASWFFQENARRSLPATRHSPPEPFLLHNVDVISTIDLSRMLQFHKEHGALATLAVQSRESSRLLLFNDQLELVGRASGTGIPACTPSAAHSSLALAFSGIHIISPRLFPLLTEDSVFSIIDAYLRLAAQGEKILALRADEYYWRDLGRPSDLSQAALDLQQGMI
ncbi:MAG TPA: nucleotidyltransferase family protein [Candidatus Acidoferrum sp.]|nr:nucleotidyltransferase family protein [Candidatus Acidoferrum sp.]